MWVEFVSNLSVGTVPFDVSRQRNSPVGEGHNRLVQGQEGVANPEIAEVAPFHR
jgi:hypothetical protein